MDRISIADLEAMTQTQYVSTQRISLKDPLLGDNNRHVLVFDIFDGYAYCADYNGDEYDMVFPRLKFVNKSKDMSSEVRKYLNLPENTILTVEHILMAYNTLRKWPHKN